ncbi:dynein regulation protein LC7 [Archaeoglobales archaeon]|nr:MAG: dynein regulation protein LC7 [Archaeoglobales archaeon]
MEIDELKGNIPKYAIEILKSKGIKKLFPPQVEAIKSGLFENNIVVAIPTASGKTLIAELVMVREVAYGGKCLYTVPLRALAMEKFEEFKKWESLGIEIGLSMGEYESKDEWLGNKDIIVTTSEKADSLLRNKAGWISKISCLVVDEIHLLDSAKRGAVLEILIAKLRKINPNLRIIALSATIPNADEIAEWLDAKLVKSDWRPTPLYEGVFCKGKLELYNNGVVESYNLQNGLEALVYDCLKNGGQVLIFDSTRRNTESTALKLMSITQKFIESNFELSKAVLEENDGEMSQKLSECIANGSAFHHAGLLNSQRKIVEEGFRDGRIKVVVATPTLAAGVNLPARRVIVKSYRRYDGYSKPIKVLEYKQMAGRAGRPGLDERGEAILIAKSEKEKKNLIERYVLGKTENIMSKLGAENHLRFHSLSLISEGFANSMEGLEDFFSQTFFFHQNEISVKYELEKIVLQLDEWEMVEYDDGNLKATRFGELVSKLYIDPLTGFIFYQGLNNEIGEISALHLICRTPDMERLYLRKSDSWVEDEVDKVRDELVYVPADYSVEYDWFLSEIKTALCLRDWINEVDENAICEKYGIAPGDLRRVLETAEWLAYSLARIAQFFEHKQTAFFSSLVSRIKHGVKNELVELVELKGIGRVRARRLYNAGIKNKEDLVRQKDRLPALIGKKIAERVLAQLGIGQSI